MALSTANPLNWNVPIVNPDRTPTHEFMQKWVLQARINGAIPTLSTPEQVSAVLDILSGNPNDVLVRGATLWEGWTIQQLLDLAGMIDNRVLMRIGGAWVPATASTLLDTIGGTEGDILRRGASDWATLGYPNDASKYLDGTGNYTVPAGGGGGGNLLGSFIGPVANDGSGCATKWTEFWTNTGMTLAAVWVLGQTVASEAREARVFTGTGTWNDTVLGTLLGTSANVAESASATIAGWFRWRRLAFASPLTLAGNTHYQIAIVRTDGGGTTVLHICAGTGGSNDIPTPLWNAIHGTSYGLKSINPVAGNTSDQALVNTFASLAIVPEFTM